MLTILFDGIAYGMLLFVLAVGLSVTLGLMNLVNLAHGAFAMAGGYCAAVLVNRAGLPFFAALSAMRRQRSALDMPQMRVALSPSSRTGPSAVMIVCVMRQRSFRISGRNRG